MSQPLAPADIQERLAAQIVSALAAPVIDGAWLQSRHPFEVFLDTGEIEHHAFAIRLTETESHLKDRQRADTGTLSATEVRVRWSHRLRPESVVLDELEALQAEAELVAAIKATPGDQLPQLVFVASERTTRRGGLVFQGELRWQLSHHLPLQ